MQKYPLRGMRYIMSTNKSNDTEPRWKVEVTPVPGTSEAQVVVTAEADDVTQGEIGYYLSKALTAIIARPLQRVATRTELEAQHRMQMIAEEHPAVRLYCRDGVTLWLGQESLDTYSDQLRAVGWVDGGETPPTVVRPCIFKFQPDMIAAALSGPS